MEQPTWHPSLRLRILAPAALVAIPALALIVFLGFEQRRHVEDAALTNATRLASLEAAEQQGIVETARDLLTALAHNGDLRPGDSAACSARLQSLVPRLGTAYTNVGVLDARGTLVCSGFTQPGIDLSDRPYFTGAVAARDFTVGEYMVGRVDQKPSIPFSLPIIGADGAIDGVVFATLDLARLAERLGYDGAPRGATVILTDRQNTVLALHPEGGKWIGRSLKDGPVTKLIGDRSAGALPFVEPEGEEIVAFERVRPVSSGLTVRVHVPMAAARAAASAELYRMLIGFSLVAVLVMVGVKVASDRLLLGPLAELAKASRRLAAGDLGARAAASTTIPELNALGRDFDAMAAALEEREAARLQAELQRQELEQQYHQSQKMDAVGRLAGGIAHDFNNMLTAILGYCDLLLDDPALSDTQRGDVREIQRAGRTAAQLTRQLLAFSRREIVEPAVLDLNAVVHSMDKMLHRLVGEHIQMQTALAEDLHAVKADRGQLEQIIMNLAVNARDAMPSGGRLTIQTANVHLAEGVEGSYLTAPPGDYVRLVVSDTGMGMRPEVLEHLFEPFYTTKDTGKGTGLGLATVYGIVKQNNGGITVESAPGSGSSFGIYLPRCDGEIPMPVPGGAAAANRKTTILVVEDDPAIRELAAKVLTRGGFNVLVADGGDAARRVSDGFDGTIDVLLSDVVMPGMNGPTVAEMLIARRPRMKVVFMSGYTDNEAVRQGVTERGMPFLQKPFTPEKLANKIAEVLG